MSGDPAPAIDDFHLGAAVHSSDGRHVGSLHRVVVDREGWTLRELVVKETRRFSGHLLAGGAALVADEVVVPIDAVASVRRDRVDLRLTTAEVRRLPPYLTYAYSPVTPGDVLAGAMSIALLTAPTPPLVETAVKGDEDLEIRAGEELRVADTGERVGTVRDVVVDGDEMVGVVVHPTGLFKQDVLVQTRFLERSDDLVLVTRISGEELARLEPFHPEE